MCRINFAKLLPGWKERKKNSKELKIGKESPFLKSENPINQKFICLGALNQIVSDLTD